jgi:hypothetical protein
MIVQAVEIVPAVAAVLPEEGLVQNTTVSLPRKAVENLGLLILLGYAQMRNFLQKLMLKLLQAGLAIAMMLLLLRFTKKDCQQNQKLRVPLSRNHLLWWAQARLMLYLQGTFFHSLEGH